MTEQKYSMEQDCSDTERFTLTVGDPCADKPTDKTVDTDCIYIPNCSYSEQLTIPKGEIKVNLREESDD